MSSIIRFTSWVEVVVTGAGSGATAQVEGEIPVSCFSGKVRRYRLRRTAGAGTPTFNLHMKTGEADSGTRYRVNATGSNLTAADAVTVPFTTPADGLPFHNQDTTRAQKLYVVFDNDAGVGDASTWQIQLEIECDMSPGGKA